MNPSLRAQTSKNILLVFLLKVFVRLVSFVATIFLLRILDPKDFGLVAIAQILITGFQFFETFGINSAIIQREKADQRVYNTGLTIIFSISILLCGLAFFIAPLWARFYANDGVRDIVRVMTLSLVISAFTFIPDTYLRKTLNFKKGILPEIARIVTYSVSAVVLALLGFRYWSLIYATLLGEVVRAITYFVIMPMKLKFAFDRSIARDLIGYGKWMVVGSLIYWSYCYLDNAIVGKLLGTVVLGFYGVAYRWGNWIIDNIVMVLSPVLFPTYSRIQGDLGTLRKGYLEVTKYVSLVIFPMTFGLIILARHFVLVLMGNKWEPAIVPLQILALGGLCRALQSMGGPVFLAVGKPKISTYIMGLILVIMLVLIYPFLKWKGIIGVSLAVSIAFVITFFVAIKLLSRVLETSWLGIVRVWVSPLLASLAMSAALIAVSTFLPTNMAGFLASIAIGGFVYAAVIFGLTGGRVFKDLGRILREGLRRGSGESIADAVTP
jgi:O-antigen/teichoic acid export membrane protein